MKIFGSYHGHHDGVMVSIGVEYDKIGDPDNLASLPYGAGIPQAVVDLTVAVPFNDAGAMERRIERLDAEGRKPACVIMEAAMMNLGIVLPEPGYLEAVREITQRHGIVLIFDEVKTGLTIAAGGATERWGVKPDMVTLAKALGGGMPTGAIGGSEEVFTVVEDGSVYQVGTYNGNPLGMAAVRANLLEVLTPEAYAHLDHLNDRILAGCTGVIEKYNLPGYAIGVAGKGCVTFATEKIVDYATFKRSQDKDLSELAWLFNMNRGIFMTPGREEEWTLSVTHTDEASTPTWRVRRDGGRSALASVHGPPPSPPPPPRLLDSRFAMLADVSLPSPFPSRVRRRRGVDGCRCTSCPRARDAAARCSTPPPSTRRSTRSPRISATTAAGTSTGCAGTRRSRGSGAGG